VLNAEGITGETCKKNPGPLWGGENKTEEKRGGQSKGGNPRHRPMGGGKNTPIVGEGSWKKQKKQAKEVKERGARQKPKKKGVCCRGRRWGPKSQGDNKNHLKREHRKGDPERRKGGALEGGTNQTDLEKNSENGQEKKNQLKRQEKRLFSGGLRKERRWGDFLGKKTREGKLDESLETQRREKTSKRSPEGKDDYDGNAHRRSEKNSGAATRGQ